jgi:hypothetical protein
MEATGLSRRIVEHSRKMRAEFDAVTEKAMAEGVVQIKDELVKDEMYCQFIKSDYVTRQRSDNQGRDLSLKRFRQLICPCMTKAEQRDTADQIVAEFKSV